MKEKNNEQLTWGFAQDEQKNCIAHLKLILYICNLIGSDCEQMEF